MRRSQPRGNTPHSVSLFNKFLVGGLEHDSLCFHILGIIIIPTDEIIFFRGVETTNQV